MKFDIIVCIDKSNGIGYNNNIPWDLKPDMKYFKELTTNSTIIMGRNTWESLPKKPLPNRQNLVISSVLKDSCKSLDEALKQSICSKIFVIGGQKLYEEALQHSKCRYVYLTRIDKVFKCDRFFELTDQYTLVSQSEMHEYNSLNYTFNKYKKKNIDEINYLTLLKSILNTGVEKNDRTGTGTISTFGQRLEFDLDNGFPLLTTKQVPFKLMVKELLWFISGSTDNKVLKEQGVHIWDGNTTKEFIINRGLSYEEDDLGPMYGFQWRNAGAEYKSCKDKYKGVDQLLNAIDLIRNDPDSRRIIINSYQAHDLDKMVLHPCHAMVQFWVNKGELSCQMYQRSADMFLGVPVNIASYALLTHIMAKTTGLKAKRLIIVYGDAHIYKNHIDQVNTQLKRNPKPFPTLKIKNIYSDITKYKLEDFELENYEHDSRIKGKMAI